VVPRTPDDRLAGTQGLFDVAHSSTPRKEEGTIHPPPSERGSAWPTQLAWAESGAGPVVVKASNWLTHVARIVLYGGYARVSNNDIAERLSISEKTVRNHASNVFDKLGVWSRAQAIVFARDKGFVG
jgi:DNA-binding CsgD family transcriptional regulator